MIPFFYKHKIFLALFMIDLFHGEEFKPHLGTNVPHFRRPSSEGTPENPVHRQHSALSLRWIRPKTRTM
jgi:hypothetical protein